MSSSAGPPPHPYLRVVGQHERPAPALFALRAVPLDARPCRPGEQPHRLKIACDLLVAREVARRAARDGVPSELWLRIVVEAARVRDDIAATCEQLGAVVEDRLDSAARAAGPAIAGCGEIGLYARLLGERSSRAVERANAAYLHVMVPDTMRCGWLVAASDAGLTLATWFSARLHDPPAQGVVWEAAAATCGCELGEWGYRAWTSASVLRAT